MSLKQLKKYLVVYSIIKMAKKSSKTETEQVATPAPTTAPVETQPAPQKTKQASKPKAVKTEPVAPVVAPVVEEPVVEIAGPADAPPSDTEVHLTEQSNLFLAKLHQLSVAISSLKTEYRTLEKKWSREVKAAQKVSSKRKRKTGNRAPSGFVKPTKISDELALFLGKEKGSEMARTEVTRDINKYIRTNSLQDKDNGRKINPDAKLASLLKLNKTDELTYFNLQRYMSPHFAKAVKEVVSA